MLNIPILFAHYFVGQDFRKRSTGQFRLGDLSGVAKVRDWLGLQSPEALTALDFQAGTFKRLTVVAGNLLGAQAGLSTRAPARSLPIWSGLPHSMAVGGS